MTSCGYIAFLGAPNAGKSTLLNALVGEKLAIVTPKAQTTRSRITGAMIHGQSQLIFVDVPGVFEPPAAKKFERAMVAAAWDGVADADIIAVLIDAKKGLSEENEKLLARLSKLAPHPDPLPEGEGTRTTSPIGRDRNSEAISGEGQKKTVLLFNKIDLVPKERLLELTAACHAHYDFAETFYISSLKGDGLNELKEAFADAVPPSPWLYPEDYLTDLPEKVLASEITREKLFMTLREELPYSLHVETESWEERADGSLKINQAIFVEREGQKGIILGKGGVQLKKIGQMARAEIEQLWGCKVHLFLFVKVREKWKDNPERYSYLGLKK